MEYADDGAAGSIPECGAIFMANAITMEECLKHKIFALPSSMAHFLKHVKAGMALFIFEYQKRKLFGVYQAISDGTMDIVPHAFHHLGKHFPAQVIFRQIWNCSPLSENEFRDAISDNYFSAKKFNFGLSEDQVHRLLSLFSAKKLKNEPPTRLETELVNRSDGKDRHLVGDDMFLLSERTCMEPKGGFHPYLLRDYGDTSFSRANNDQFFIDRVHNEGKIYPPDQRMIVDYPDEFFTKRRRLDNDERLLLNKVTEDGSYNSRGPLQFPCIDNQKDYLNEERRFGDNCRVITLDRIGSEDQVDKNINPVLSAEYVSHPWDIRMTNGDILMDGNRMSSEFNEDISFGRAFETERFGKPLDRSRLSIDDDRFLIDDCIQTEYNTRNAVQHTSKDLLMQARKVTNDGQCCRNVNLGNRYHVYGDGSPGAPENLCNLLHKVRKTAAGGNLPINERIQSEPDYTCSVAGLSSEKFANPLHYDLRTIDDGAMSSIDRKATESIRSAAWKNSGYILNFGGQVVDGDRFRGRDGVEIFEDIEKYVTPVVSSEYPSLIRVPQSHDPSSSTFDHDTEAYPYVSVNSAVGQGCSLSLEADRSSILVRPYRSMYKDFSSRLESKTSSTHLDIAPECENKGLATTTSSCQSSFFHEATKSCIKSKSSMPEDPDTSDSVGYRGSLFLKHSIFSAPYTGCENTGVKKGFPFAFKSKEHHYAPDGNISDESRCMSGHVRYKTMDVSARKKFNFPAENDFSVHVREAESDLKSDDGHFLKLSYNKNLMEHREHSEAHRLDSGMRKSVFTRLTSGQDIQLDEEINEDQFDRQDCFMDASADEVLEMLHKGNNLPCSKLKNIRIVGQHKHGETSLDGKQIKSHGFVNQFKIEKKMLKDAYLATVEGFDKVPEETRIVDFKRRSETKKNLAGSRTMSVAVKNNIDDSEDVKSPAKKIFKRKRLVRPVFMENELAVGDLVGQKNTSFPGQILDKDDEQHNDTAISSCEFQIPNDYSRSKNAFSLGSQQSRHNITKDNTNHEALMDPGGNILSCTHHGLKRHAELNVDLETGSSQVALEDTSQ